MRLFSSFTSFLLCSLLIFLPACEFKCSVGKDEEPDRKLELKDGARVYNGIILKTNGVKVEKAYLLYEDGEPVPDANVVEFTQPVKLVLSILEGWKEENGMVNLGVSEKISTEKGEVLLDEPDLFAKYETGMPIADANRLTIIAKIILKTTVPPLTTFTVSFRVWDKNSDHFIEGSYKLFSK